jgi:exosortase
MRFVIAIAPRLDSPWVTFGVPAVFVAALYAPLFPRLLHEWLTFPNLSHGVAIPAIAGYLIWARRSALETVALRASYWGLPVLVLGLAALVVGVHGEESFLARISLPVTLLGVVLALGGWSLLRHTWPAIGYLVFMVPMPWVTIKVITYRSRLFDATVSAHALNWMGIPVFQDGVLLHLPNIVLEVADECSSIPAIAALMSLGVAYATLARRSLPVRLTLIAATLPFAIGSNIIRIIATAAGVHYIGPIVLQSLFHQATGTVNFLITFLLLLALDQWLVDRRRPS